MAFLCWANQTILYHPALNYYRRINADKIKHDKPVFFFFPQQLQQVNSMYASISPSFHLLQTLLLFSSLYPSLDFFTFLYFSLAAICFSCSFLAGPFVRPSPFLSYSFLPPSFSPSPSPPSPSSFLSHSFLQPFLGSSDSVNQVSGKIKLGKEVLATLEGHWVRHVLHTFFWWLLVA